VLDAGLSLPAVNLIFTGIFAHGLAGLVGPGGSTFSVENQKVGAHCHRNG
jgi:hypothetical protein